MNLQYLTENSYLLSVCSKIIISGRVLQPGQLLPKPAKPLHNQHRQSHAVTGLSEKIPSIAISEKYQACEISFKISKIISSSL